MLLHCAASNTAAHAAWMRYDDALCHDDTALAALPGGGVVVPSLGTGTSAPCASSALAFCSMPDTGSFPGRPRPGIPMFLLHVQALAVLGHESALRVPRRRAIKWKPMVCVCVWPSSAVSSTSPSSTPCARSASPSSAPSAALGVQLPNSATRPWRALASVVGWGGGETTMQCSASALGRFALAWLRLRRRLLRSTSLAHTRLRHRVVVGRPLVSRESRTSPRTGRDAARLKELALWLRLCRASLR